MNRGDDWKIQSKAALKRDKHSCQLCMKMPKKVHVHHIIPYRKSKDNSLTNLITLCPSCHGTQENEFRRFNKPSLKVRRWQEKMIESSGLFVALVGFEGTPGLVKQGVKSNRNINIY